MKRCHDDEYCSSLFFLHYKMGASQSKTQEPIIFYNPSVPLQFSQSLVGSLEKKAEQTTERVEARQVESIVRQRVTEELKKMKQNETELSEKYYVELAEKNSEKDNLDAISTSNDIETMIERISRSGAKELPAEVKKAQDDVIACYNSNKSRTLNCWQEVVDFKQAVSEEQKKFIGAHQN